MGIDQRRYRKLYVRTWSNKAFRALDRERQLVAIYLLTGPQTNRIGLYKLSIGLAGEDLDMAPSVFLAHVTACCQAFGWRYDSDNRVFWIPSWWAYNLNENEKNFRGALSDLAEVPDSFLVARFLQCRQYVPSALHRCLDAVKPNGISPIERRSNADGNADRTQEQEQEQENNTEVGDAIGDDSEPAIIAERAGRFLERYSDLFAKHSLGAVYPLNPVRDYAYAQKLVALYPDTWLDKMAELYLLRDDTDTRGKTRTVGQFAATAPWCDMELRRAGMVA
jgi:hypothetical protein